MIFSMGAIFLLTSTLVLLHQVHTSLGFFGGGFPGFPNFNARGQIGECYVFDNVCNANIIKITDVEPYNRPLLSTILAPLIIADPTLNTKNCDAMCKCLTGKAGSCERMIPFLNDNGCELLRFKCRCNEAFGVIQQAQAAARLFTGRVCV